MELKKIKISQIKQSPIRHTTLPDDFIERIKNFKEILGNIDTISLEKTIDNFKRDAHPENELKIWEHIAKVYKAYIAEKSITDLPTQKEVYSVILRLSMGMKMEDFSDIKILSQEQLENIIYNYNPLTIKDIL